MVGAHATHAFLEFHELIAHDFDTVDVSGASM